MPEALNRRLEGQSRALLNRAETMLARARSHLLDGDPLKAMRLTRAAEQLDSLNRTLRARRAADLHERAERDANTISLRVRELNCKKREDEVALLEKELRLEYAEMKELEASIEATYQLMRDGDLDGPTRATGERTDLGVAPI